MSAEHARGETGRVAADRSTTAGVSAWPDEVEEILGADQAVVLAYTTPARGVVLAPLTNFAAHDRARATITLNSSAGMWRKLARIAAAPEVAVAFHTREHSLCERPEFVLLQGRASLSPLEDLDGWYEHLGPRWEIFGGQSRHPGPPWERWLSAYHARVEIEVSVSRVTLWPDLRCAGEPRRFGEEAAAPAAPQARPRGGVAPRLDHAGAAARLRRLPDRLLALLGADGLPVVLPVEVEGSGPDGIHLACAPGLVAPGGRRAALIGHRFSRHVVGQEQLKHTGWLEAGAGGGLLYAPHTSRSYRLPASRPAYNLSAGFLTRRGLREARRRGFLPG